MRVRAPAIPRRAAWRSAAPPRSGQARPAARSACATSAQPGRARVREQPAQPTAGRRATAERSCGARARTVPAQGPERGSLAPAHHRRDPDDELLDRARVPRRACGVPEPEQVSLDRVRPGLQAIVTRRDAPPLAARASDERTNHQAAGLGRQRRPSRPIPDAARIAMRSGGVLQRHRQRPRRTDRAQLGQRRRADARGAAGRTMSTHSPQRAQARNDPPRELGIADPSDERLQFGTAFMWAPHGAVVAEKPPAEDRAGLVLPGAFAVEAKAVSPRTRHRGQRA